MSERGKWKKWKNGRMVEGRKEGRRTERRTRRRWSERGKMPTVTEAATVSFRRQLQPPASNSSGTASLLTHEYRELRYQARAWRRQSPRPHTLPTKRTHCCTRTLLHERGCSAQQQQAQLPGHQLHQLHATTAPDKWNPLQARQRPKDATRRWVTGLCRYLRTN